MSKINLKRNMKRNSSVEERTLKEIVSVNTNQEEDVFVGIKCINNNVSVNFPLGFRISNDDYGLKEDIQLLLKTLLSNTNQKESQYSKVNNEFDENKEPIQSYMYLIQDYLSNGLFKEREITYQQNNRGKINWGRTIKTQNPSISNNSLIYLDLVTKKNKIKEDDLITQIHRYCIQVSFSKIWWLYLNNNPIKETVSLDEKLFESVLNEKICNTFNDNNRLLFEHMLAIIKYKSADKSFNFKYGTYRFEYIWEKLIDKSFGIVEKKDYFPNTRWHIKGRDSIDHTLRPDTIMISDNSVFIIDAKYYKYGVTKEISDLPWTESITKQIAYGEYVHSHDSFKTIHGEDLKVYNAFIMPYDKSKENKKILSHFGYATSEWKQGNGEYEEIQGILLDVKDLMCLQGGRNKRLTDDLQQMILEHSAF